MINPRRSWRCIFFSLFLFLISLSLFSSQLRNLPRTLNGLVSPSAPLLRADLFYLFAQPRGKSADYVEILSPKPCESTSFQSFSRSFLFSFSPFLSSFRKPSFRVFTRVFEFCQYHTLSAKQIDRLLSPPLFADFRPPFDSTDPPGPRSFYG